MRLLLAILIFFASFILIGQNLDKPFWGEHDWNGVRYGNIARNYLRYGLVETKAGQVENSGFVNKDEFEYYTHYPPLLPLSIGLSYKFLGISEYSIRLIPLLSTAGSIVLIFLIGSKLYSLRIGIMAALLGLITPMSLYFGKNASHEPLALFFILFSFYGYISIGKLKYAKLIFILGLILAELTAWAGYFLIPSLTLVFLLKRDLNHVKNLIPYWILSFFLFGIHLFHVNILTGSITGGDLLHSLFQRTGLDSNVAPQGFNIFGYLNQLRLWFSSLFTLSLTSLAIFWLVTKKFEIHKNDVYVLILGLIGLIYISFFSNSVFIHNYLIFYFLPFLALGGALGIDFLMRITFLQRIYLLLIFVILLSIFFERKNFLDALNKSSSDKFAVEIGKAINVQTKQKDIVLVSPLNFSYSAEKFLKFYSDRKLIFEDKQNLDYDYRVEVDQASSTFQILKK